MPTLYDVTAPKKPTNLNINSDLLAKNLALGVNLTATLEQVLLKNLATKEAENWQQENQAAIQAYNSLVEEQGLFADEHRQF